MVSRPMVRIPGAVAAVAFLVLTFGSGSTTATPGCDRLVLTTRDVRWELRDHVEDYYQYLRAAEMRLAQGRWENVYESEPATSGELGKYVSLGQHRCGQAGELDVDPDARAEYALGRAFGVREADRLFDSLDEATFAVSFQVFRPVEPDTPIPWRDLGALFTAITRTESVDGNQSGPGLRLVSSSGATPSYLWIRPATADAGMQIFRFRVDLSSPR